MANNPLHSAVNTAAASRVQRVLPPGWLVRVQEPITTTDSEPEPDLVVVRGAVWDFADRHPDSAEVGLVVEVSDSSLRQDRARKRVLGARAGIPAYWIVNLTDRQLEVHQAPGGAADPADYTVRTDYRPGDRAPLVLDGALVGEVEVADLFPPQPATVG